jgi:FdhD protein
MTERLDLAASILFVSGRVSFEIAQKAAVAGIPVVCGVSAASSLAIDLAASVGLTLAGFVREGSLVVYTRPDRLS